MTASSEHSNFAQLPDEMFTIIKAASHGLGPRLGRLVLSGREPIETPHFLGITSRGVVPHLTQDTFARDTRISGVYVGLEDFIERGSPPVYKFKPPDGSSPLRRFIALPDQSLLVVGARRTPPVAAPAANPNTNTTVSVCTVVGFKLLTADGYASAVEELQADIVVGLGDIPYGHALGSKRIEKATDRTIQWLEDHVAMRKDAVTNPAQTKLFAALLPVTCANQQFYIDYITNDVASHVHGLAIYSASSLDDLPENLDHLPRLGFTAPKTPHDVLSQIALGLDIVTIPFITSATDAGIALNFTFAGPKRTFEDSEDCMPLPLGIDMWSTTHAIDLSPLTKGCTCYACTNHHRAYIQHLLAAKEMLGWVLLQIHNHHIIDLFFSAIRTSIANGTFDYDVQDFARTYESRLPEKTGQGPRVRGYQFKSEGPGEPKKNIAPFTMLDDGKEKLAEATPPSASANANDLEDKGFAEKQQ